MYLPGSAEGLRWYPLRGIEKPGSGTEPIHQEHVMCSWFRGSCPSDVKSAGHPEPGFSISLSGCSAAICAPRETQKTPAAGSVPAYRRSPCPKTPRIPRLGQEPLAKMGQNAFLIAFLFYVKEITYRCIRKVMQKWKVSLTYLNKPL